MKDLVSASIIQQRFILLLLACFAALALLLAAVGIYGVMSYAVTQRTQEIGIRMALGASVGDVLKLIVRNGIALTLIGVAIGLALAFALTRLMTSLLFGVTPTDALTFAMVSGGLVLVALVACYIPAARNESRSAGSAEIRIKEDKEMGAFGQDVKYGMHAAKSQVSIVADCPRPGNRANTAIFSVVNAVLLRPLPFPKSDALVSVFEKDQTRGWFEDHIPIELL